MVETDVWEKLFAITRMHTGVYVFKPWRKMAIKRESDLARDLALEGEVASDFLEEVGRAFPEFELARGRGDFVFTNYFLSEASQSVTRALIYALHPSWKKADATEKLPMTLGMLEDAIARGYWETARYLQGESF